MPKLKNFQPIFICLTMLTLASIVALATAPVSDQWSIVRTASTSNEGARSIINLPWRNGTWFANNPLLRSAVVETTFTVTNTNDSGPGSLRQAIEDANLYPGTDTIDFALGVEFPSIELLSALPFITTSIIIDGSTGGSSFVELNGAGAGASASGLFILADNCSISGLIINRFAGDGVAIASNGNTIKRCLIGVDSTGSIDLGNGNTGINIGSANNLVGGTTPLSRNVISGNNRVGVNISGSTATGNRIIGNYIGVTGNGSGDLGNSFYGVAIFNAPNNTIGGTTASERNVISGNDSVGVLISNSTATGNKIIGNYIGTDATGLNDLGNTFEGVQINNAPANWVGGTTVAERNIISGNNRYGVYIFGASATGNKVSSNYIGTDETGMIDLGNTFDGVQINNSPANWVGGTTVAERNIISGNNRYGVFIFGASATGNKVSSNYIGTNVSGTIALGNSSTGVLINGNSNNTIGGTTTGERNIISGNLSDGVLITGTGSADNKVSGNYIGTTATGATALGNRFSGVAIFNSANNTIGGTTVGERNIISGNKSLGVNLNGLTATGNKIIGNYIGTDVTGTIDLGNAFEGVAIGAPNNTIGGSISGERNLISGNQIGISVGGTGSTGNKINGNFIGTDFTGNLDVGNDRWGVLIYAGASNNTIGGTGLGDRNIIAGNDLSGISLENVPTNGTGNKVLTNSIFNNSGLGIDLGAVGVTANDLLDTDTGPNNLQNYPVLSCAVSSNGTTRIQGTLNSLVNTQFRIEFFVNDTCDASGNGEGQTFIGFTNVTTDTNGDAPISTTIAQAFAAGKFITATATKLDVLNNPVETSEFSACKAVVAPTLSINDVALVEGNSGTTNAVFTVLLTAAQGSCLPVVVNYATADGTATLANGDYVNTTGTLIFNPPHSGSPIAQTITVPINGDLTVEANETLVLVISNASGATITKATGVATITNDDNRVPVALCQNVTVTADATCTAMADINNGSSDPDGDALTITQSPAGPYAVGTYTVMLRADDGRGGVSSCTATVTVNAPKPVPTITNPTIGTIAAAGTPVNLSGTFTDTPGTTHTAMWQIMSDFPTLTLPGIVTDPIGTTPGTVTATHTFATAGIYEIKLTVTNNCGETGSINTIGPEQFSAVIVIYDPTAGFVTGNGWINSPAGAFAANPLLTGKANFGFVSKYVNGATLPTGETDFKFKAGDLNFTSTSYEWLVIAGAKAQFKGNGTINGQGNYRFMLTVIDGQQSGGGGTDKFRIRIWSENGGGLLYDNQLNAPDSADPTTIIGGGQITIRKK